MEEKLLNKIISVAYGDAKIWERIEIYWLSKNNLEVKNLLEEYKKTAVKVHTLKKEEFSGSINREIENVKFEKFSSEKSLLFDLYTFVFRRPAVSSAILAVFILALVSTFIFERPEIHRQYTKQEIELADKQVKQSFALIASVFNKTKNTVEKDVLTDRVSKPIRESFNLVNNYLQGDKNENIN